MSEKLIAANAHVDKHRTYAKFGDGPWYAILPSMDDLLRKAGAEISVLADGHSLEEARQ